MNAEYFIKKFEAIPEGQWCMHYLHNEEGQMCANGHCGAHHGITSTGESVIVISEESIQLQKVFSKLRVRSISREIVNTLMESQGYSSKAALINNGHAAEYQQETPKQRILAALRDIQLLELQDKAVTQIQEMVNEQKPDDVDTSVSMPKPRPKNKLVSALAFAWIFILNIF